MRLTLSKALMLALIANLLPGCERTYADRQEAAAAAGGTAPPSGPADAAPPDTAPGASPR
jgi:hypothetical protein